MQKISFSMIPILHAVLIWLGRLLPAILSVGSAISKVFDVVTKFLSQSKIFFTVLFVGFAVTCFISFESFFDWVLDALNVSAIFEDTITYGFFNDVIDIKPLLDLGKWYLSYWLTEKAFMSGIIGTRILYWFTMGLGRTIHL